MQIFEKLTHNGIFRSGLFSGFAHCAEGQCEGTKLTIMYKIVKDSTAPNQETARENSVQCRMQEKW